MKKTAIAIILILAVSVTSVFALDGFSFFAGIGYDTRSIKDLSIKLHSMEIDVGAKYPIGNGFNVYTDMGFRFVGGGKIGSFKSPKDILGLTLRGGLLYGMRFVDNPQIEAYVGGGLTFSSSRFIKSTTSTYNAGVGLKLVGAYRLAETCALTCAVMPDLYFFNNDQFKVGFGAAATVGTLFKF